MSTRTTQPEAPADLELQKRAIFAWLDALRSGEFKQGHGQLSRRAGEFDYDCCLAVGCRVLTRYDVRIQIETVGRDTFFNGSFSALLVLARETLGLKDSYGQFSDESLSFINDNGGTFPEIADTIEREARSLFVNGEQVSEWI